ncbi:hypothetical protein J6590_045921 [Homalodisca vitripennis]|nr:hypothetical protein J6590_045921 [Homalodisca vitripennis]
MLPLHLVSLTKLPQQHLDTRDLQLPIIEQLGQVLLVAVQSAICACAEPALGDVWFPLFLTLWLPRDAELPCRESHHHSLPMQPLVANGECVVYLYYTRSKCEKERHSCQGTAT